MWFFKKKKIELIKRNFEPSYFSNKDNQDFFETNGYVILKNIVSEIEIEELHIKFNELKKMDGFDVKNKFESSGNFNSIKVQEFVFDTINKFMQKIAIRFAKLEHCEIGDGGAFFIKPNTKESILHPHQDSAVIDETKYYCIFVWIPLIPISMQNGPLYVLPKSHLWGNSYRSQHIPWVFKNSEKKLWKNMIPILLNKGDILCFDSSIIHASETNNSTDYRIVVCGALLPKNHQKVEYIQKNNSIYKYDIDNKYWLDGGQKSSLINYNFEIKNITFTKEKTNQILNSLTQ